MESFGSHIPRNPAEHHAQSLMADQASIAGASAGTPSGHPSKPHNANHGAGPANHSRSGTLNKLARSFQDAAGTIVFGMEDGTVSIFGLVFGVAASAPNSHAVLLAGATGAAAAAVSMMAGTYLDVQSSNDQARVRLAQLHQKIQEDPASTDRAVRNRLIEGGFSRSDADSVLAIVDLHPDTKVATVSTLQLGAAEESQQSPRVQAAWMLSADLLAASVPVLPFAFMSIAAARLTSLGLTVFLLIGLGVARAFVGQRRVLATVLQTIGIASGAGAVGAGIAKLIT